MVEVVVEVEVWREGLAQVLENVGEGKGVVEVGLEVEPKPQKAHQSMVEEMHEGALRELVLKLVDREPGLLFDLCEGASDPGQPIEPSHCQQSWCKCGNCRQMTTELENKCCGCLPRNCVSMRDELENLCINPQVLAMGRRYHREMLCLYNQPMEEYNKAMRHAAYRNFILWRHGRLGAGIRRVIPSCCVWMIRDHYPSQTGQYTGFKPNRYM